MEKLFEVRKDNIIKPLSITDAGFVFKTDNINAVIKDIECAKYGSYLVGGGVGTGKSSLIDMAASLAKKSTFIVHVNFYNEEECIEKFLVILLEKIIKTVKSSKWFEEKAELCNQIASCEKRLYYDVEVRNVEEKYMQDTSAEKTNYKGSFMSRIGVGVKYIFKGETAIDVDIDASVLDEYEKKHLVNETITMTKKQTTWLEEIENVLEKIPCERIVIVYDELDKMNQDILKELFKKYKALFVEKNIFHYFLVNEEIFSIYSKNDLIQNPYFTYFVGCYYIKLLNLEETLRYCKMMFAEDNYINGLSVYYFSLGNYRLINRYYLVQEKDYLATYKAYILKNIYKKMDRYYLRDDEREFLLKVIKMVIEEVFNRRDGHLERIITSLNEIKNNNVEYWYKECIENIIEMITVIAPRSIERRGEEIMFKPEVLIQENLSIRKNIIDERSDNFKDEIMDYEKEYIFFSDMYNWVTKEHIWRRKNIFYLNENIIPLKVADNVPEVYNSILANLLKANLQEHGIQVIILKRKRGDESYYKNDYVYTGMVVIDKTEFQIAYYVNEGSYESDRKDASEQLMEWAKNLNVDIRMIEIKKRINVDEEIRKIVYAFNNDIYEID